METFKTHHFILQSGGEQNWGMNNPQRHKIKIIYKILKQNMTRLNYNDTRRAILNILIEKIENKHELQG